MDGEEQKLPITITYRFEFSNTVMKDFSVHLDPDSLALLNAVPEKPPAWTHLDFNQCTNCPLKEEAHCPVALRLSLLVKDFAKEVSHKEVLVRVYTEHRIYEQLTTVQRGLSSIMGIIMATSGCPILDKLRPNTAFHLPFASSMETAYRMIGMYLVAQVMREKEGLKPDWTMQGLLDLYHNISTVNRYMSRRLQAATEKDASTNAIVILHSFSEEVQAYVEERLREMRPLFETLIK